MALDYLILSDDGSSDHFVPIGMNTHWYLMNTVVDLCKWTSFVKCWSQHKNETIKSEECDSILNTIAIIVGKVSDVWIRQFLVEYGSFVDKSKIMNRTIHISHTEDTGSPLLITANNDGTPADILSIGGNNYKDLRRSVFELSQMPLFLRSWDYFEDAIILYEELDSFLEEINRVEHNNLATKIEEDRHLLQFLRELRDLIQTAQNMHCPINVEAD